MAFNTFKLPEVQFDKFEFDKKVAAEEGKMFSISAIKVAPKNLGLSLAMKNYFIWAVKNVRPNS